MLPFEIMGLPVAGYGFGLGSRVMLDVATSNGPGSVGEFGSSGAAETNFWVDPIERIVAGVHGAVHDRPRTARPDVSFRRLSGNRRLTGHPFVPTRRLRSSDRFRRELRRSDSVALERWVPL